MSRKKLSDNEGRFLKGDQLPIAPAPTAPEPAPEPIAPAPAPAQPNTTEDAMSQIFAPAKTDKEPSTRFTADLPDSLHERLSMAALKAKKTKVQLVREILNQVLPE